MTMPRQLLSLVSVVGAISVLAFGAAAQMSLAPNAVFNRSYLSSCGRDNPTKLDLKNGKFGRYFLLGDEDRRIELIVLGAEKVEIANDRRQTYAVFARCDVLGNRGYELFILRRSGKTLVQIANAVASGIGGLHELRRIRQPDGLIVAEVSHLETRGLKVRPYEFRFKLTGTNLELVDHRFAFD